jgi:hypothetical protein
MKVLFVGRAKAGGVLRGLSLNQHVACRSGAGLDGGSVTDVVRDKPSVEGRGELGWGKAVHGVDIHGDFAVGTGKVGFPWSQIVAQIVGPAPRAE